MGGTFDVESLVENLLHQLPGNLAIIINVYDTTNKYFPVLMYGMGSNSHHISELDFGDLIESINCIASMSSEI